MKTIDETIEERASEYAHTEWISEFTDVAKESYTKGATEQKAIDIDKACEWLKNSLREYGIILFGHWESDFRKAMEK